MSPKSHTARSVLPHRPGRLGSVLIAVLATLCASGCGQDDGGSPGAVSSTTSTTSPTERPERPDPDELTDGTHQVRVDTVDLAAGTVTVDGLEVLEGTAAVLAYLADTDGNQLDGPQVYVRNQRGVLHDLPVDPEGEFAVIFGPSCCEPRDLGWRGFAELAGSGFPDVWGTAPPFEATIDDGVVTSLVQIYVP